MSIQDKSDYESLLDRLQNKLGNVIKKEVKVTNLTLTEDVIIVFE